MGEKAYALLRQAMLDAGKVAIAQASLRGRDFLAAIRATQRALLLHTMFYQYQIRSLEDIPELNSKTQIEERELALARELIEHLFSPFEPEKYSDAYREALEKLVTKKIAGEEVAVPRQSRQLKWLTSWKP